MKKIVRITCSLFAALVLCLVPFLSPAVARAGSSDLTVADKSSISSGIDGAVWLNFGSVKGENGKIVFDGDVKPNGRVVATSKIQDYTDCGIEEIFSAEYTIKIDDIPTEAGNRFAVAFGMNDMEDKLGSTGSTEIYFVKSGSILKAGVSRYSEDGEVKIAEPESFDCLSFGTKFTLGVSLASDKVMNIVQGFTAIGQNGICTAEVSSVKIKAYRYFNAETPLEITENFDNGHYNRNAFFTRSTMEESGGYSGGCYVENGALKFDVLSSFISTVYRYSNFELTFDLTDVQREDILDDNGNILTPAVGNSWFGISFGAEENRGQFDNHMRNATVLTMHVKDSNLRMWTPYPDNTELLSYPEAYKTPEMDILNKDNAGKIYNYKISMKDGKFTASYKLSTEENYPAVPLVNYDLGYTPYGSVSIISYVATGYTIDNIRILNTDYAPHAVTVTYEKNGMQQTGDYKYTDGWSNADLLTHKKSGCSSALNASEYALIIATAAIGAATAVACAKKRRDK